MRKAFVIPAALCGLLLLAGCDAGYGPDETHPVYQKALRCRSVGKYAEAEALLKQFLKKRPKSSRGCLALAQLYDEKLNDPLSAVYYYREFLKLEPDSTESRDVHRLMQHCEERLQSARLQQKQTRKLAKENVRLKKTLLQYGKNVEQLRVELSESEKRAAKAETKALQAEEAAREAKRKAVSPAPVPVPAPAAEKPQKTPSPVPAAEAQTAKPDGPSEVPTPAAAESPSAPEEPRPPQPEKTPVSALPQGRPDSLSFAFPAAGLSSGRLRPAAERVQPLPEKMASSAERPAASEWPKTYVVKPGDTLSEISRKFYGTTQYYVKIMEANQIQNTRGLAVGQKLILPAPEKEEKK